MRPVILAVFLVMVTISYALSASRDISSREAKAMLERNKNVFILDVRTPQEDSQGRVPGAMLIPLQHLEQRISQIPKNKPVIVYCAVGGRSKQATDYLSQQGYKDVYNMTDGIVGWSRNGFPVQR